MEQHNFKPFKKAKGFEHPLRLHKLWHVKVTYINLAGTFFSFCSLLNDYSQFIDYWEICEHTIEAYVETIMQRGASSLLMSDQGSSWTIIHSSLSKISRSLFVSAE